MVRPRTINREHLLDAAEELAAASGAASLTFGGIAAAAGLSKATVQSAFGTREALIEAMLERWLQQEQQRFSRVAGPNPSPETRIRAHIRTAGMESEVAMRRAASILVALAGSEVQSGTAARWYETRIGTLEADTDGARRLRMAFLAAEGAFFLRYLAGLPISDERWRDIFQDLESF